jgi:drug/metabolite transporter (DMT)-like permease
MILVTLYGLGAAITWALGSVLVKAAVGKLPANQLLVVRALAGAVTALGAMAILGGSTQLTYLSPIAVIAILGATVSGYFAADLLFVRALEVVPLSQALPIQATYPVIAAGMAWAALAEPPTWLAVAGAIVVFLGVAAVATSEPGPSRVPPPRAPTRRVGLVLLGLSTLGWAVSAVLLRFVLRTLDPVPANALISVFVFLLFASTSRPAVLWSNVRRQASWAWLVALAGVLGGTGLSNLLFVMAVESGGVMVATTLSCTAPLFSSLMAVLCLEEKLSARLATGILLTVGGVLLIVAT